MRDSALESDGFGFYVGELKRGSPDPYFAYRVYEKSWKVPPEASHVVRAATIRLIEADPWFLATAMPHFLGALRTKDLERLTPFVGAGQSLHATAMLRATLWYYGRRGPYHPDRAGREQLLRALAYLQQVPRKHRDRAWHEMLVGCYRILDYDRYKRAFPALHKLTSPEWRASGLISFLNDLRSRKDWGSYDRYRPEWGRLPPGHHACECYLNDLHTNDGLRAAADGDWSRVAEALTKAATIHGCPHLNTGGLRLDLVELLIGKKKQLDGARAYLDRAARFGGNKKAVDSLRRKLDRLAPRA